MSDWAVGDLAVRDRNDCPVCCSKENIARHGKYSKAAHYGHIYKVIGISPRRCPQGYGLIRGGLPNSDDAGNLIGWCRHAWRKIRPDEREACEPEFVTLLQRIKRKEVA